MSSSVHSPIADLYLAHHSWLAGWLRRKLGCPEHAQDLTQDTFVQVMAGESVAQINEPRAYLTVIAKRVLFNFWRRRDLEQAYLDALVAMPEAWMPSEEERLLLFETLEQIDCALDCLPHKAKQVFLLNQLQEMTYAEIADNLGMPIITVRRHMKKAIGACVRATL